MQTTQQSTTFNPSQQVLILLLVAATIIVVWWIVKRPKEFVGCKDGEPIYALSIHWLAGAITILITAVTHLAIYRGWISLNGYRSLLEKNLSEATTLGGFLFITVGGLIWKPEKRNRWLKLACAIAAGFGLVILLLTKIKT